MWEYSIPLVPLTSWVSYLWHCVQDENALIWYSGGEEKILWLSTVSRIIPGQRTVSIWLFRYSILNVYAAVLGTKYVPIWSECQHDFPISHDREKSLFWMTKHPVFSKAKLEELFFRFFDIIQELWPNKFRCLPPQPVFSRYPRPEKEYQSFSLIYSNEERSLDLVSILTHVHECVVQRCWLASTVRND